MSNKKNVKKSDIVITVAATGLIIYGTVSIIRASKEEKLRKLDIKAIREATRQCTRDVANGRYDGKPNAYQMVEEDFAFYYAMNRPARPKHK
jgi:hypothetical protein